LELIGRALGMKRYIIQAFRNVDTLRPDFAGLEEFSQERVDRMNVLNCRLDSVDPRRATAS
jgi:hypothetical protein